jgi:hypothetical protein
MYEIKTNLFKLGDLKITRTPDTKTNEIKYNLESSFELWSIYSIEYIMEATFVNDTLINSLASIKVNGKSRHFCKATKTGSKYTILNPEGKTTYINHAITSSITPLYFEEYEGPDSIYTEFSGSFCPFIRKNDFTYVLNPKEDPMEFIFNHGHLTKVIIPNAILDFYIELKPDIIGKVN